MAIVASLIERTPNKLRYLCVSDGGATTTPDTFVIPNAAGVTPDLRTDAGGLGGYLGSPLATLVSNTPIADQAEARTLLDGAGLTSVDSNVTERGMLYITPRNSLGDQHWGIDTNEGLAAGSAPSTDFAVLVISGPNTAGAAAVATIEFDHTYTR